MTQEQDRPIGVFDSGVGGLTVLKALKDCLPDERFLYLGDTARLPYGSKSPSTITRYAFECSLFLLRKGIKMLVVACNSASSTSVFELKRFLRIPVHGVIVPGAGDAVEKTATGRIGVIGTEATVRSHAYREAIHALRPDCEVLEVPCPLFVPLVEEGWTEGEVCHAVARRYLEGLLGFSADTVVLGCTHYPLLRTEISRVLGDDVCLVDSATSTAHAVRRSLAELGLRNEGGEGSLVIYLSDVQPHFREIGERCIQEKIESVEIVQLDL